MINLIQKLGFKSVYSIQLNQIYHIGLFKIIPRKALDFDVDSIFHIQYQNINVLNVVDSWIDDETLDLLNQTTSWDLIFWPFQTMRELEVLAPTIQPNLAPEIPHEWINQLKILKPKNLVPSSCQFKFESWSWYNKIFFPISYNFFNQTVKDHIPNTHIFRLDPGDSIQISEHTVEKSNSIDWIKKNQPNDEIDYIFNPETLPIDLSKLAQYFEKLNPTELVQVENYCKNKIIKKYKALQNDDLIYFQNQKRWQLIIYYQDGNCRIYNYIVSHFSLKLETATIHTFDWKTEICATKLYNALFEGESLTSLYIRINHNLKITDEDIDIMEDPLIRCLYTNNFGSYQKAQIKKILKLSNLKASH